MLSNQKVIRTDANEFSISSLTATGSEAELEPEMNDETGKESTIEEDNPDEPITIIQEDADLIADVPVAIDLDNTAEENTIAVSQGGRPKGTTNAKLRKLQRNKQLA
jgi:hypothetical protein